MDIIHIYMNHYCPAFMLGDVQPIAQSLTLSNRGRARAVLKIINNFAPKSIKK